jgi:ATP/maltotriose-dependent transcriptional regulator MalT
MAMVKYDLASAKHLFQKALDITRELGDQRGAAWAQVSLGSSMLGDTDAAIAIAEEGLAFFRQLNHKSAIALTLNNIGDIARVGGDDERARRAYEECLGVCRETGETRRICVILFNLGFLAQHVGDHERARDQIHQGIALAQTIDNKLALALGLTFLAGPLGSTGQRQRAVRLLGASEAALERIGAFLMLADKVEVDRNIAAIRAQLDDATFQKAWAEGREMTLDQAVDYALHNAGVEMGRHRQRDRLPLANPLTTRELEILHLMAQGMSNRAIAERLFLAVGSVKWYGSQICNKLQVHNRLQAIVRARELNILP